MKKLTAILLLVVSTAATAHGPYYRQHPVYPSRHYDWMVPTIIGGFVGYGIARSQQAPVIVQQPPIIVTNPPGSQYCSPWTETRNIDGSITLTRTCTQ